MQLSSLRSIYIGFMKQIFFTYLPIYFWSYSKKENKKKQQETINIQGEALLGAI